MKDAYSSKEIASALGVSVRAVQKKAKKEEWCYVEGRTKRRGRKPMLYLFSSLPIDVKQAIIAHEAELEHVPNLGLPDPGLNLSPKDLKNPKMARKIKIAQFIKTIPRGAGREAAARMFAKMEKTHRATIWRWVKEVENRNGRPGSDEDLLPKSKSFSPQALAYGLATYARNIRCGKKAAYMALKEKAFRSGWNIGDYTSFTRLTKKVPEEVWARLEKGELGFELNYVPKIIRKWLAVPVQSVICGDQKIFDYLVYDPETESIVVPNGYFWMDCSSRFINGVWIELGHYNSFTVGYSLREALRYGIPDEIFTDWGKPEGSKHIAHIRDSIRELCYTGGYDEFADKYYLDHRKAQPCKPWQKPIENIMNQIDILLKNHFPPGYRKRASDAWENKEIQKQLKRQIKASELMTVQEFIDLVFKVVDEHNTKKMRLREGGTIVPADEFKKGLQGQSRIRLANTTLDFCTLPTWRRVPRQGKVGVQVRPGDFREFFSFKLSGHEAVYVTVDPYDREAPAIITDLDLNFVDLAEPIPRVIPGESSSEAERFFRARTEYMKEIRSKCRQIKDAFGLVDKREVIAIGKAARTAKKAREAVRAHDEAAEHRKRQGKLITMEARRERKKLERIIKEANTCPESVEGFQIPDDSRARYRLWKELDARRESLSEKERTFWKHFQNTADFSAYRTLEEDFGDVFMARGRSKG